MDEKTSANKREEFCISCNEIFTVSIEPTSELFVEAECPYCGYLHQIPSGTEKSESN
ncbi:MAG: hypothetical protein GTN70_09900 [Deltaproteobacteria bacterium]|nr:hypothetical protein [Deltaproteobacteria bacterium]NIS78089.1 hypothetical protein [Deltaproteobacteria bacterium]